MDKIFTWCVIVVVLAAMALNMYGNYPIAYLVSLVVAIAWIYFRTRKFKK